MDGDAMGGVIDLTCPRCGSVLELYSSGVKGFENCYHCDPCYWYSGWFKTEEEARAAIITPPVV
jgi:hypothetical protein